MDTRTGRRGGKKKNSFYGNNPAHGGEDGVGEDEGEEDGEGEEDRFQSFTELWQSWKTIAQLYGEGAIGPAAHKVLGRAVLRRTFYQLFNRFIRRRVVGVIHMYSYRVTFTISTMTLAMYVYPPSVGRKSVGRSL